MLILSSTSDIVRVVTGAAAMIEVHVDYVDLELSSGVVTPGRTNTSISTATTTTICASPASGVVRNVRGITVTNNGGLEGNVEVQHYDGTTSAELIGLTLLSGENLIFNEMGDWRHFDSQGAEYAYVAPPLPNLGPTGCLAETIPRHMATTNTSALASGTLFMHAIYLVAGQLVSNITIISATTAANTPTNCFFALYDKSRGLLAQSANQTTTAWAANTARTLAMTSPYRVPKSGLYYIGIMVTASTVPTIHGGAAKANAIIANTPPVLHGASTTGLTTSLPNPAGAITGGTTSIYAAVT